MMVTRLAWTAAISVSSNRPTRYGGYSKYRWRVRAYPIDEAAKVFELNRPSFQTATVLGSKNSLQTTCV
eukprot:3438973-Prymnesium_polylepis.2